MSKSEHVELHNIPCENCKYIKIMIFFIAIKLACQNKKQT